MGFTPLIIAAYANHIATVKHLLQAGASADGQDSAGNTALMGAAYKGYQEVAQALVLGGADVNL